MSKAIPSNTTAAAVRKHFGLTQAELGRLLGVTAGQVAHVEAGRRSLSPLVSLELTRLALLLPPEADGVGPAGPAPEPSLPSFAATPADRLALEARLDYCRYHAEVLRYELRQLQRRAKAQRRRQWAAGVLRTALLPEPGAALLVPALAAFPPRDAAKDAQLLEWMEADTVATALPTPVARRLVELRARLLEEEATEIAAMLAEN